MNGDNERDSTISLDSALEQVEIQYNGKTWIEDSPLPIKFHLQNLNRAP